ncbi:MAG: PAS domain-containing protein [Methylococcaceae bacterium]|nr:PAS domain-containing protein [Methylococcaceae bacterium]
MASKWNGIERRKSLRTAAESLVASLSPEAMTAQPVEALVHELIVHKIELEMQNEELRNTHAALEEALERYRDLYEFAPVAYLTVTPEGLISDINRIGTELLGVSSHTAINRRFATFVAPEDRGLWNRQVVNLMECAKGEQHAFDLMLTRADGTVFRAHLDCLCRKMRNTPPILRVAVTDNGNMNPAQEK